MREILRNPSTRELMANSISDEELQLKKRARRRLVGAIALVLLIVVFLPMILDGEPRPLNQDVAITIPPIPKPESTPPQAPASQTMPAASLAPAAPHVAGMPEAPAAAAAPKPESTKSDSERIETKPAQKHHDKSAAVAAAHGAGDESFVVQLGAFSNAANARALQKRLQDNKFKAYSEIIKNAGGDRTRVRVGPYASREAAEKARDRLKAMKLVIGETAVVRLE
jgi:DedD protein